MIIQKQNKEGKGGYRESQTRAVTMIVVLFVSVILSALCSIDSCVGCSDGCSDGGGGIVVVVIGSVS
jgi:hypothetical protein